MYHLYIITAAAFLLSFVLDRQKTVKAIKIGYTRFTNILPAMLMMLVLVSFLPVHMADTTLFQYFGHENVTLGVLFAATLGSITMFPGFIAFPLCGLLRDQGVPYMVLSAFTTTLMMVGIVTYPVEKAYLGHKITIVRNVVSFGIALLVSLITGIVFGEVW